MDPGSLPAEIPPTLLPLALQYINLNTTLGAIFLGAFAHAILYGILCLQCYVFFDIFSKDMKLVKLSVATLWVLSSVHIAMIIQPLYQMFVTDFGTLKSSIPWTIGIGLVTTALTDTLVKSWFTYRILILSRNKIMVAILIVFVVLTTVGGLWLSIECLISPSLSTFSSITWLFYFNYGLCAVSDLCIALSLCYYLYRQKNPLIKRTNSTINFLMAYAINTGLFTGMVGAACMITHGIMPDNYIFLGIYFTLGPLYANALLGSLNARDWFRTKDNITTLPLNTFNVSTIPSTTHDDGEAGSPLETLRFKGESDVGLRSTEEGKVCL